MTRQLTYIAILLLIAAHSISYGQSAVKKNDTLPIRKVIFEDDFNNDYGKRYLSKWSLYPPEKIKNVDLESNKYCTVEKTNDGYALSMTQENVCQCFAPLINSGSYRADSLALDFDFLMEDKGAVITLNFCSHIDADSSNRYCTEGIFYIRNDSKDGISMQCYNENEKYFKREKAGYFNPAVWHHFRINFNEGTIICAIDQHLMLTLPETGFFPNSLYLCLCGSMKFTNAHINTVNKNYGVSKLVTDKKLITHAIQFEKYASAINSGSLSMLLQLTQFLKQHPTIKLEIADHTDNDGDTADNMTLSQQRADEIKRQMVALGIKANRLTAKGYGGTKPIQPNTTPEGKAENRRVEFIKR